MTNESNAQPPITFWIIGVGVLLWNLIGVYFYYMQVTLDPINNPNLTEAQQLYLANYAAWATSAFAIAVTAGVLASAALLMRKALATIVFIISLVGLLAQNLYAFGFADGLAVWGNAGTVLPAILIAIGVGMILYSRSAQSKGWIS